tara:strand:- start:226 stop:399 length:174 start_codon:yes stop_codon:yes gene_type:complete
MDSTGQEFEKEYCVSCGEKTKYFHYDHIDTRIGYIEGAGQLCSRCNYNKTFYKQDMK